MKFKMVLTRDKNHSSYIQHKNSFNSELAKEENLGSIFMTLFSSLVAISAIILGKYCEMFRTLHY